MNQPALEHAFTIQPDTLATKQQAEALRAFLSDECNLILSSLSPETTSGAIYELLRKDPGGVDKVLARIRDNRRIQQESVTLNTLSADAGHHFLCATLSNIEGRVLAWLANDSDALASFKAFDEFGQSNEHRITYADAFDVPHESVTIQQGQIGEVMDEASRYGGGIGAYVNAARKMKVDVAWIADHAAKRLPERIMEESALEARAAFVLEYAVSCRMEKSVWIGLNALRLAWRESNPGIIKLWGMIERAFRAVLRSNATIGTNRLEFRATPSGTIDVVLPSGREIVFEQAKEDRRGLLSYAEYNFDRQCPVRTMASGGSLTRVIVKEISADIARHSQSKCAQRGFTASVANGNTIVSEVPDDCTDIKAFARAAKTTPRWASGLPIFANGFVTPSYYHW